MFEPSRSESQEHVPSSPPTYQNSCSFKNCQLTQKKELWDSEPTCLQHNTPAPSTVAPGALSQGTTDQPEDETPILQGNSPEA